MIGSTPAVLMMRSETLARALPQPLALRLSLMRPSLDEPPVAMFHLLKPVPSTEKGAIVLETWHAGALFFSSAL
jgi:hypothetical protein